MFSETDCFSVLGFFCLFSSVEGVSREINVICWV